MKFIFLFILLTPMILSAQDNVTAESDDVLPNWELATTAGVALPSNLGGVTEMLPAVRYSIDKGLTYFRVEAKYLFSQSEGIKFRRYYLSVKNNLKIYDMNYFWLFGLNMTEYQRNTIDYVDASFIRAGGWHYGFGVRIKMGKKIFLRSDVNVSLRPGRFLYAGAGLGFTFGGASGEKKEE